MVYPRENLGPIGPAEPQPGRTEHPLADNDQATQPRTTTPPPGWFPDPWGQASSRWWDGRQWTSQVQAPPAPQRPAPPPPAHLDPATLAEAGKQASAGAGSSLRVLTLAGAAMVTVGSLLPWANVTAPFFGTFSIAGTDGDGTLTLVAGLVVGALTLWAYAGRFSPGPIVAALVVSLVSGVVAIVDMADVSGLAGEASEDDVSVAVSIGIGLWLVLLGAVAATGGCILSLVAARRRPPPTQPPATHPAAPTLQGPVPSPPPPGVTRLTDSTRPPNRPTLQAPQPNDRPAPPASTPTATNRDWGPGDPT
jgi:hypothetical protein